MEVLLHQNFGGRLVILRIDQEPAVRGKAEACRWCARDFAEGLGLTARVDYAMNALAEPARLHSRQLRLNTHWGECGEVRGYISAVREVRVETSTTDVSLCRKGILQ